MVVINEVKILLLLEFLPINLCFRYVVVCSWFLFVPFFVDHDSSVDTETP